MAPPRMRGNGRKAKDVKGTLLRLVKMLFTYYKKEVIAILACILITALVGVAPSIYVQTIAA